MASITRLEPEKPEAFNQGCKMKTRRFIPVASPVLIGNEKKYVNDCLDSTWISSSGKYVQRFEEEYARHCGSKHAITCCNGTVALHLVLLALGVKPGDEVIVPTLTFVATANAVAYCGATPRMIDSEPDTWNLDPELLDGLINERTKGIIAVHLYGHPVDMDPVLDFARKHNLFVVEDAAEAHGATYKGRMVGSIGDVGTFSFYGNKIITTGEGGMVVTSNDALAAKIRLLKGQGMDTERRYWFPIIGYNYRMTNVAAAIGLGQLEMIDWHINRKREIDARYKQGLKKVIGLSFQGEVTWAQSVYWMSSVLINLEHAVSRDEMMDALAEKGIETRPLFFPMHTLPMYKDKAKPHDFPVAERLSASGINLPSSAALTRQDQDFVIDQLTRIVQNSS